MGLSQFIRPDERFASLRGPGCKGFQVLTYRIYAQTAPFFAFSSLTVPYSLAIVSTAPESTFFGFPNSFSMGKRHLWPVPACTAYVAGKSFAPTGGNQPARQVPQSTSSHMKQDFQETA
jgi:hypothetical protein